MSSRRYTPRYTSDIYLGAFEKWDLLTDVDHYYLIVRWGEAKVDNERACRRDGYTSICHDPERSADYLKIYSPELRPAFAACMRAYNAYFLDPSISPNAKLHNS